MADRIVKPDSGNDLVLQNDDGSAKIEINEAGTIVHTGTSSIDVSGGTFTTSSAQKQAIVDGSTITGVPQNLVAYTSAGSAPTGFSEYNSARGRMIVGLPASGTNEGTVGTAFTNAQDKSDSHSHTVDSHTHNVPIGFSGSDGYWQDNFPSYGGNGATGQPFDREWNRDAFGSYTASIPKTLGASPGTNQATLNTSDFLAYIQLMTIKKD